MSSFSTLKRAIGIVALAALTLTGQQKKVYSPREKAYYMDAASVQFIQPGLVVTINSANIAADGTMTVVYTLTDPNNLPLDAAGVTTPGAVTLGFIAAVLPNNQEEYFAYTTKAASGTAVASTNQPSTGSGGVTTQLGPGQYQYVFHTKAPSLSLTGLNPVTDPQGPINPIQHFSSACTGCHMDMATAAHTLSNTNALGEACNVCHGAGAAYAVDQVHAQY